MHLILVMKSSYLTIGHSQPKLSKLTKIPLAYRMGLVTLSDVRVSRGMTLHATKSAVKMILYALWGGRVCSPAALIVISREKGILGPSTPSRLMIHRDSVMYSRGAHVSVAGETKKTGMHTCTRRRTELHCLPCSMGTDRTDTKSQRSVEGNYRRLSYLLSTSPSTPHVRSPQLWHVSMLSWRNRTLTWL
eukprot:Rmarinus@m.29565